MISREATHHLNKLKYSAHIRSVLRTEIIQNLYKSDKYVSQKDMIAEHHKILDLYDLIRYVRFLAKQLIYFLSYHQM